MSWLICVICVPLPGEGYDVQLKEILDAQILPLVEEFDNQLNNGTETPALTDK